MNKTKIKAEVVADSLSPQGERLTSLLITFPRIILAEINTHRMLSKNTSSSRAIPFKKMVESVESDPFIPIAWQKDHKGMQGTEYFTRGYDIAMAQTRWLRARDEAINNAQILNSEVIGVTKQLCNRLLEPFMWTTMLITGSKEGWDNFFELRCGTYPHNAKSVQELANKTVGTNLYYEIDGAMHTDGMETTFLKALTSGLNKGQAEIHIMDLSEKIYDAVNESTPKQLQEGEWHIPFKDKINLTDLFNNPPETPCNVSYSTLGGNTPTPVKISTAMAARTSYTVVGDEKEIDYKKLIGLHDRLLAQNPPHSSPMEHCARAMTHDEYYSFQKGFINMNEIEVVDENSPTNGWCRNFKGFIQYRHLIETGVR